MKKQLFSVYPRKIDATTSIYYYHVYDENGKRKQFSTGKKTKQEAYEECLRLLKENRLLRKSQLDFCAYTQVWFDYDKCPYIQAKLSRGFSYSRNYAHQQRHFLETHAQPYFKNKRIDVISATDIEGFLQMLKSKGYSNITINHHLKTLKVIFKDAHKRNNILYDPCQTILLFKSDTKEKGLFTSQEVSKLFNPATIKEIWGAQDFYVLNYLAYCTGMRLGEIQALQKEDIKDNYILVTHSWDRKYGIKGTK
jgi:hypothetical protein